MLNAISWEHDLFSYFCDPQLVKTSSNGRTSSFLHIGYFVINLEKIDDWKVLISKNKLLSEDKSVFYGARLSGVLQKHAFIISRVSGRGHRIGTVFPCVCLCVCLCEDSRGRTVWPIIFRCEVRGHPDYIAKSSSYKRWIGMKTTKIFKGTFFAAHTSYKESV